MGASKLPWAWQIGAAIEAGIDEREARRQVAAGEFVASVAGAAVGGGAAAAATGLGGVGLAFGGGAIGIGAAAAVAAPAVAAGAVAYGVLRGFRAWNTRNREQTLRGLVQYFRATDQLHNAARVFHIEGMGALEEGRHPPTHSSAKAALHVLAAGDSPARTGFFCSLAGEFVLTYDMTEGHWAYVRLIGEGKFSGGGKDLRGREFRVDDLPSVDLLLRTLEREGFVRLHENPPEEQDDQDSPRETDTSV